MRVFKILKTVFIAAAATLMLLSVVLSGAMISQAAEEAYFTTATAFISIFVMAIVGIFLLNSNSDTAKRVGHGLTIAGYAAGLTVTLLNINHSTCAIIMLIAVIMLALYYFCVLVLLIMGRSMPSESDPNEDIRIIRVRQWKKIMEEGVISQEEYEKKRCELLGIVPEEKSE